MPGSMIHLLMARKVKPNGSTLYYLGSIAPDAVSYWKNKDITHFRYLSDRSRELAALALQTPPSDDFAEGILLHIYTDWKWDIQARDEYIKATGSDWLHKYREELRLSGIYAYHHSDWAKEIWNQMVKCDVSEYGNTPGAAADEVREFLSRNYKWHNETKTGASSIFTPGFIEDFINDNSAKYNQWKIAMEIDYYNSLPVSFDNFINFSNLTDGEISLYCTAKKPAIPEMKWVPAYKFEIRCGSTPVGNINLRIGYADSLYYGGQIGYNVDEQYRGHGYAARACRLLKPVMAAHGMNRVLITNDQNNTASRRVCEKLGAKLIRVAPLPEWHDLYKQGLRYVNIFEWSIE